MGRQLRTVLDRLHPCYALAKPLDSASNPRGFAVGDAVYAQNYGGHPLWLPGSVAEVTGPCSYKIEMGQGRIWCRHKDQLRARRDGTRWQGEVPPREGEDKEP